MILLPMPTPDYQLLHGTQAKQSLHLTILLPLLPGKYHVLSLSLY